MKFEIEQVRRVHEKLGLAIRDVKAKRIERDEGAARRRAIRIETDGLIRQGLQAGNLEEIAVGIAGTMSAVAGGCLQFGVDPAIPDLVTAAKELIEDARIVIDGGYSLSELDQVAVGSVMLHVICVGLAGCLGVPYRSVLEACTETYLGGGQVDRAKIAELIARSEASRREGAVSVPEAAESPTAGHGDPAVEGNSGSGGNDEAGKG